MHTYRYEVGGQAFEIITDGTNNVTVSVAFERGDALRPIILTKGSATRLANAILAVAENAAEPSEW